MCSVNRFYVYIVHLSCNWANLADIRAKPQPKNVKNLNEKTKIKNWFRHQISSFLPFWPSNRIGPKNIQEKNNKYDFPSGIWYAHAVYTHRNEITIDRIEDTLDTLSSLMYNNTPKVPHETRILQIFCFILRFNCYLNEAPEWEE